MTVDAFGQDDVQPQNPSADADSKITGKGKSPRKPRGKKALTVSDASGQEDAKLQTAPVAADLGNGDNADMVPPSGVHSSPDTTTLDLDSIDALLADATGLADSLNITGQEVDSLVGKRREVMNSLRELKSKLEENLAKVDADDSMKDLSDAAILNDEGLVELSNMGAVDKQVAERLARVNAAILRLERLRDQNNESRSKLDQLGEAKRKLVLVLQGQIDVYRKKIDETRQDVRSRIQALYGAEIEVLEKELAAIDANPLVGPRIEQIAAEEDAAREMRKQQKERARLGVIRDSLSKVGQRHDSVFAKIQKALGDDTFRAHLSEADTEKDPKKANAAYAKLRAMLARAILLCDDKNLPKGGLVALVPWIGGSEKNPTPYNAGVGFLEKVRTSAKLKDANPADKEIAQNISPVLRERDSLRRLFGRTWMDPNNKEAGKTPFWAAFEQRRANDKREVTTGNDKKITVTQQLRAEKRAAEEKAEAEAKELALKIKDILTSGGKMVNEPVYKGSKVVGEREGAILLEDKVSKPKDRGRNGKNGLRGGNPYVEVVAVAGLTLVNVGETRTTRGKFPEWLRDQL